MEKIVEVEYPNQIQRFIFWLLNPLIVILLLPFIAILKNVSFVLDNLMLMLCLFFFINAILFLKSFNYLKYYIVKIEIDDNLIFIQYFRWNKIIEFSEDLNKVKFNLFGMQGTLYLKFFVNKKHLVSQWEQSPFSKSKWNEDLLREVEAKLKPILKKGF